MLSHKDEHKDDRPNIIKRSHLPAGGTVLRGSCPFAGILHRGQTPACLLASNAHHQGRRFQNAAKHKKPQHFISPGGMLYSNFKAKQICLSLEMPAFK